MLDRGLWICFEGADGVGKTTIMRRVANVLNTAHNDLEVIETAHPGSTALGRHLRVLHKTPHTIDPDIEIDSLSSQLLMMVDHVNFKNILLNPAIERGAIILADRCNLISGIAYGLSAGLSLIQMSRMLQLAFNPRVDRMYILHCNEDVRRNRLSERGALDKWERQQGVVEMYTNLITGPAERTLMVGQVVALENIKWISTSDGLNERPVEHAASEIYRDIRQLLISHQD